MWKIVPKTHNEHVSRLKRKKWKGSSLTSHSPYHYTTTFLYGFSVQSGIESFHSFGNDNNKKVVWIAFPTAARAITESWTEHFLPPQNTCHTHTSLSINGKKIEFWIYLPSTDWWSSHCLDVWVVASIRCRRKIMSFAEPDVVPPRSNIRLLIGSTKALLLILRAVTSATKVVFFLCNAWISPGNMLYSQ